MKNRLITNNYAGTYSRHQQLFFEYIILILVDLTILNLFDEYSDNVYIQSFSISLLVAVMLQFMLQFTISLEHKVSAYFKTKEGTKAKVLRGLSIWLILFSSKLIILEAINFTFGKSIVFSGAIHGLVAFIIIIITMIIFEQLLRYIYRALGEKVKKEEV